MKEIFYRGGVAAPSNNYGNNRGLSPQLFDFFI